MVGLRLHYRLPLLTHLTKSYYSQAQQDLLSPLSFPSPFPGRWFRKIVDRDSENLVNPLMRVTSSGVIPRLSISGARTESSAEGTQSPPALSRSVSVTEAISHARLSLSPLGPSIGRMGFPHRLRSSPGIPAASFPAGMVPRTQYWKVPLYKECHTRETSSLQGGVPACTSFSLRLSHPSSV